MDQPNKIVMQNPAKLTPYAKNAKVHKQQDIDRLAGQIAAFGFDQPILVDTKGVIIKGHKRREAAMQLGLKKVPTLVSERDEYDNMANRLADNAVFGKEYNDDMVQFELGTLKHHNYDLNLTGYDTGDLERHLSQLGDGFEPDSYENDGADNKLTSQDVVNEENEDLIPQDVAALCNDGDVWILGRHRLLCGDCTNKTILNKLVGKSVIDMVFTDPPYGMCLDTNYADMHHGHGAYTKNRFASVIGDNKPYDPAHIFASFPSVKEVLLWGADYYVKRLPDGDSSWYVWDKRCDENMDRIIGNTFELCWSMRKHKREVARILWSGHHGMHDDDTRTRVHPTQKPVKLIRWFFDRIAGDSVVDLFAGSGSTLIACEQTNRTCFACEIDPHYCDVIIKRWQDFTGQQAIKT